MSAFRRRHRHAPLSGGHAKQDGPGVRRVLRSMILALAIAVLASPATSLGATTPAAAPSAGTAIDLQQERAEQAALVKAALEAQARRLSKERHEAWVAKQLAKRTAAYQALVASNRARYGAMPDWDAIADCESNNRWDINTGNGYWGGLQFSHGTWFGNGGGAFDGSGPFPFTRAEQIMVAEHVLAGQGPHAWPVCFRWK